MLIENIRESSKKEGTKEAEFARALAPSFSSLNELYWMQIIRNIYRLTLTTKKTSEIQMRSKVSFF